VVLKLESLFLEVNGSTKLHYAFLKGSSAKVVLLLNGFSRPLSDFRGLADRLNKSGMSVVLVDVRGSGLTEWSGEFSMGDLVEDIAVLAEHLGLQGVHVAGISMGGMIAQVLAMSRPGFLGSVSLVSTAANRKFLVGPKKWPTDDQDFLEAVGQYFAPEFAKKNRLLIKGFAKSIRSKIDEDANIKTKGGQDGMAVQRKMLAEVDLENRLGLIDVPVQIMHGAADRIISSEASEQIHKSISGSTLHLDKGVGHLYLAENIQLLASRLTQF